MLPRHSCDSFPNNPSIDVEKGIYPRHKLNGIDMRFTSRGKSPSGGRPGIHPRRKLNGFDLGFSPCVMLFRNPAQKPALFSPQRYALATGILAQKILAYDCVAPRSESHWFGNRPQRIKQLSYPASELPPDRPPAAGYTGNCCIQPAGPRAGGLRRGHKSP